MVMLLCGAARRLCESGECRQSAFHVVYNQNVILCCAAGLSAVIRELHTSVSGIGHKDNHFYSSPTRLITSVIYRRFIRDLLVLYLLRKCFLFHVAFRDMRLTCFASISSTFA